ncbi:MAG: ABC transporter permease [Clostridia bacterium]
MEIILNLLKVTLEEGIIYAILAIGVYISYSILDFPDLSVDGTMPLGAIVTAVMIIDGMNPWFALLVSFIVGSIFGMITGILHVKFNIRPLLCGILVSTALLSINLVILLKFNGGNSLASFFRATTIFNSGIANLIPSSIFGYNLKVIFVGTILAVAVKIAFDMYLKTKSGLILRATGNNERYVCMLGVDAGVSKIIGLALGNGFAALSGSIIAQSRGSADTTMGTGMVVFGLASVIIGVSVLKNCKFMKATTMVIIGSILYKASLTIALALGLPTEYLKLLMAIIFVIALVSSDKFTLKVRRGSNA